jgi:hypothetical protein
MKATKQKRKTGDLDRDLTGRGIYFIWDLLRIQTIKNDSIKDLQPMKKIGSIETLGSIDLCSQPDR